MIIGNAFSERQENAVVNEGTDDRDFTVGTSGHPPPKWEQELQTRITTESIREAPEISGRTNGSPEQLYTKTQ